MIDAAHRILDLDAIAASISNTMDFNQAVFGRADAPPPQSHDCNSRQTPARIVSVPSVPFDEPRHPQQCQPEQSQPELQPELHQEQEQAEVPHLVPAVTSLEEENTITGSYSNVEDAYVIDPRVLGSGHHGSVRECVRRTSGKRYAVKSIRKNDPNVKPGGLAREIVLLREMSHDNVIGLVDVFEDRDYVHLVTELCQGGELFDRICELSEREEGPPCFEESEAARIMSQILEAVSYMHSRNIAHRDIKPENVLFQTTEEGSRVKLIDFGLSRKHRGSKDGEPPMSTVVGTPYYIAPEVLKRRYDKSCDVWSVGVVAYIMLCGYPPFNGTDSDSTHRSVLKGRYYFPAEDWGEVSGEAMDFIYRCLQMDPRRRMTAERALDHPWIAGHRRGAASRTSSSQNVVNQSQASQETRQDNSSIQEAPYYAGYVPPPPPPSSVFYPSPCSSTPAKSMQMQCTRNKHGMVSPRYGTSPPRIKRKVRMSNFHF